MTIRADAHKPEFHRAAPPQLPVRLATTAPITISTGLNVGDSIDGVTLVAGDRVLVKDQSTGSQNGVYVAGASPARAFDMEEGVAAFGALIYVIDGSANGGKVFANTNTTAPLIGTTALTFTEFPAASTPLDVTDGTTTVTPTTEVEFDAASFAVTDQGGGSALVEFTGSVDPADDTAVWMPLTTVVAGDPELVWDGSDSLIPTLTPI